MDHAITRTAFAMPTTTPPAAATRLVGEFQGFVDGEPFVAWTDRTRMPNVGEKLYAGMTPAVGAGGYALTEERIEREWNALDGFKMNAGQCMADWDRARRVAFARAIERALAGPAGVAPRAWSILLTSANHGVVGPLGHAFKHAGEHHERVVVVEVPAAAGAPSDQVNLALRATSPTPVGASTVLTDERIGETVTMKRSEYLADRDACFQRGKEHGQKLVAAQAGQVAATELQVRRATDELSLPELAEQFAAVEALGCDYTLSAKVCGKLFRAMTTPPDDAAGQVAVPEDARQSILQAVTNCRHSIESKCVKLYAAPNAEGNALSQLVDRIMAAAPSPAKESK